MNKLLLYHIKVEREISDDNFDFHMRSETEPTEAEILKVAAEEHYWTPETTGEEYRLTATEVTI